MSLETAMEIAKLQSDVHETRMVMLQLRKFLAGALCASCGEPLGHDEEIVQNDEEETLHARCESEGKET